MIGQQELPQELTRLIEIDRPRIGSFCSGYGGLDQAVEEVTGGKTVWVSDIDPGACKILEHRFPDAPNLGDMTALDWGEVPPVDILCGGTPCQDLSAAGRRAGMKEGTRSNLWVAMREAIATIRPRLVAWENVRGALSASASSASDMEPGEGSVGDGQQGLVLRALGRVLGDLSSLGYDAEWATVPASAVGAPHRRDRVFLVAWPASDPMCGGGGGGGVESCGGEAEWADAEAHWSGAGSCASGPSAGVTLLPTPVAQPSGNTPEDHLRKKPGREQVTDLAIMAESDLFKTGGRLLPTPRTSDTNGAGRHGSGGVDLRTAVVENLLPTPRASDGEKGGPNQRGSKGDKTMPSVAVETATDFGAYAPAIERWERVLGRRAPEPTIKNPRSGKPQLSPVFVSWMMGLPEGWVSDSEIGLSRVQQLRALGNGVVPQQAVYALRGLLGRARKEQS